MSNIDEQLAALSRQSRPDAADVLEQQVWQAVAQRRRSLRRTGLAATGVMVMLIIGASFTVAQTAARDGQLRSMLVGQAGGDFHALIPADF